MPPKPRGRGGARGRGAGRGVTTSSYSAASTSQLREAAPPPKVDSEVATEISAQSVVPKQEDDEDTQTSPVGENAPIPAESQPAIQRVESLKSAEPSSRSASPAARRGASTRGRKPIPKPTFTGRRSKEERDARAKAELERERERNAERLAREEAKQKEKDRQESKRQRAALRGRGGYGAASGPFSMGSSREERKSSSRNFAGYGSGSGSRAVRVKREYDDDGPSHKSSDTAIKKEDGGYISSEDDENAEFPRKDIDLIEISSSEGEGEAAPSLTPERRSRATLPVRIGRKEHQERVVGINTEASSETSAKILEQAEASGTVPTADVLTQPTRKGKGKAKEVEITSVRKPFRGVWQDPDEPDVQVKTEPVSDDEDMRGATRVGINLSKEKRESPEADRKPKIRIKGIAEPVLQTDEDRAEWARFQSNLRHIRAELGPEDTPVVDGSGDVQMIETAANASKPSVRDNNVYLFQIPPIMPELLVPNIKKEPSDQQQHPASNLPQSIKPEGVPIKVEEGFSDPNAKTVEAPRFASGHVGKLRVHQSGRTTMDWGGTSYELAPGNRASFLQEVVSIHIIPEKDRVVEEDAGEAVSFGRVKGKFVVVPDWSQMLN